MAEQDILKMRVDELKRYHIVSKIIEGSLSQVEAAEYIGISERQIRRIVRRVEQEGERGVIHRSRGKPSNRRFTKQFKRKVLRLYEKHYGDFGPTLAQEKLEEINGISISVQSFRNWLMEAGQWEGQRKRRTHRRWRERKAHMGEMIQLDGSHHEWLEGRGPEIVLMAYVDDATGRTFARFYEYEGTIPAMDSFKRYTRRYGLPQCLYLDKHSTYRSRAEPTVEQLLCDEKPLSQFERAMKELGVDVIHAHSPQAKGRVERGFRTHQDRLVKELRLAGATSIEDANRVLVTYLVNFNRRFARVPANDADLHRRAIAGIDLKRILSIRTERTLHNDRTVAHKGELYQVTNKIAPGKVIVEEHLDGRLRIRLKDRYLNYRQTKTRPVKRKPKPLNHVRKSFKPQADHPWKRDTISASNTKKTGHF